MTDSSVHEMNNNLNNFHNSYTKTHRIFVWAIMYLTDKPAIITALKNAYRDESDDGSRCMRQLINFLEGEDTSVTAAQTLYSSSPIMMEYWVTCCAYLRHTLKNWLDRGHCC